MIGQVAIVPEPENPPLFNEIALTQPTFITWTSDAQIAGVGGTNPFTFSGAGTGFTSAFDLVLADNPRPSVPDGGATAMLLTAALSGLGLARQFAQSAVRARWYVKV